MSRVTDPFEDRLNFLMAMLTMVITAERLSFRRLTQRLGSVFGADQLPNRMLEAYTALAKAGAIETTTYHDGEPSVGPDTIVSIHPAIAAYVAAEGRGA